jgi:hypothetical protein
MIPDFSFGDVLPPFMGADAAGAGLPRSPYRATVEELADRFCTSAERADILDGFLSFREELRQAGFARGFQWIDGSFVENCECVKGRSPGDIDVVSALHRPGAYHQEHHWRIFVAERSSTLFNSGWTKARFRCDAYFIDLDSDPSLIAEMSAYWVGLFSHQRDTFRWKGMVQVPFDTHDTSAHRLIVRRRAEW